MSGTHLLTQRQIRFMEKLPEGHKVVSIRDGAPIVRRPDGRLLRMQRGICSCHRPRAVSS